MIHCVFQCHFFYRLVRNIALTPVVGEMDAKLTAIQNGATFRRAHAGGKFVYTTSLFFISSHSINNHSDSVCAKNNALLRPQHNTTIPVHP